MKRGIHKVEIETMKFLPREEFLPGWGTAALKERVH